MPVAVEEEAVVADTATAEATAGQTAEAEAAVEAAAALTLKEEARALTARAGETKEGAKVCMPPCTQPTTIIPIRHTYSLRRLLSYRAWPLGDSNSIDLLRASTPQTILLHITLHKAEFNSISNSATRIQIPFSDFPLVPCSSLNIHHGFDLTNMICAISGGGSTYGGDRGGSSQGDRDNPLSRTIWH